jgi:UDPglucose 6-dehydrogenase
MDMSTKQKITIIGTGYVGLVSAAVFADWGHDVMCLDINHEKIEKIKNGIMPIYEEGLDELVKKVYSNGSFKPTTNYEEAISHGNIIFICVGTPSNQSGAADLKYVFSAAESIARLMKENEYKIIVTKSTVPVGTNQRVEDKIKEVIAGRKVIFDVVSNPEFLREGTSIYDANHPDRVVLGSKSSTALNVMSSVYEHLNCPIVKTDLASAELIKYAANSFLATKIAFINEISQICERTKANVQYVAEGMGLDNRIGPKFLNAGIGYGGSCFPKDVEALYRTSNENMYDFRLLRGVMDANARQKYHFIEKITNKFGENLSGLTIGVLGAAFKNGTDDVRKSPAIEVIRVLKGLGAKLKLFDPAALENARRELGQDYLEFCTNSEDVFYNADAVVILTEWKEFTLFDYSKLKDKMSRQVIFDGRNLLKIEDMSKLGIEYYSIGR